MATNAIGFDHRESRFMDANVFGESTEREGFGVVPSVETFGEPLAHKVVRDMAIVASGDRMMTAALPCSELRSHDVAIQTRRRIIGHVRRSLGVVKREGADSEGHTHQDHCDDA